MKKEIHSQKYKNIGYFLEFCYVLLIILGSASTYVIYDQFIKTPVDSILPSNAKKEMEQMTVLISVFYILIFITSLYLLVILVRHLHFGGDANHILTLVLSSFLVFYGFISVIPAGIAITDGADEDIYVTVVTSVVSILVGFGVMVRFTF